MAASKKIKTALGNIRPQKISDSRRMDEKKVMIDCQQDELHRAHLIQMLQLKVSIAGRERSLAKTTKLVNRLRRFFSESNVDQILGELSKLDLTMYIEEAVSSLIEGYRSMRLRDTNTFLQILCDLQSCYPQLGSKFIEYHQKGLESVMQDNLRLRIYIRTITELVLLGICVDEECVELVALLKTLLTFTPQTISGEVLATRLNAIVYWVTRYHGVCLGRSTLDGNGSYELVPSTSSFPQSTRSEIEELMSVFFHKRVPKIINHIKSLIENEERRHEAQMINKGIVDPESVAKHESLKSDLEKLETAYSTIQKIMQFEVEVAQEPEPELSVKDNSPVTQTPEELQFSDDSERSFYLELIDLASRLPSTVLELQKSPKPMEDSFVDRIKAVSLSDEADKLAIEFFEAGYYCESNLVRIRENLFGHYPHPIDPVQLRFVATLGRHVAHDFSEAIVDELRRQAKLPFKNGSHSQIQIAAIKNLGELSKFSTCPPGVMIKLIRRFIDEFDAHNAEMASWVLVACGRFLVNKPEVSDMMGEQITRLVKLRNSSTIHLPRRIELMVDHAYYAAKPRQDTRLRSNRIVREKSQIEKYIDHLIRVEIYRMHEDALLRLVRKLPWAANETVEQSLREGILDLGMNANFDKSYCIASLLAGLIKFKEAFVLDIIDDVLERFQIALEKDDFRQAPYRVRLAKLISELYVYKLIDANTIFDLLFHLIGFRDTSCYGASEHTVLLALWDEEISEIQRGLKHSAAIEEPPWSHVRVILISTILTSCGEFFMTGRNKIKLRRFILCLRRYVVTKSLDKSPQVVNKLADLFEFLKMGKVDWIPNLDQIDVELGKIVENIRTAPSAANVVQDEDEDSSYSSDSAAVSEDSDTESESSSDEAYVRDQESRGELADFDKELQSMLVESITEGKNSANRTSLVIKPPPIISVEDEGDVGQAGTFRVITRAKSSPGKTGKIIQVPETNKLNQSQEKYRAELEAAQKEKQAIKRFIMEYQRREEREAVGAVTRPPPPTLATAAGLAPDALETAERNHHVPTRRKYRKL